MESSSPKPPEPWFFYQATGYWERSYGYMVAGSHYVVAARNEDEARKFALARTEAHRISIGVSWRVPDDLVGKFAAQWPGLIEPVQLQSIGKTLEQSEDGKEGRYLVGDGRFLMIGEHREPAPKPKTPVPPWLIERNKQRREMWDKIKPYVIAPLVALAAAYAFWANLPPK